MRQCVVGIDPGATGAIVALGVDSGKVLRVQELAPFWREKRPGLLVSFLEALDKHEKIRLAAVERQQGRPGEGITSVGTMMYRFGLVDGVLSALGVPSIQVLPVIWRRELVPPEESAGTKAGRKKQTIAAVEVLLPDLDLTPPGHRVKQDGIADAAGIALYARSFVASSVSAHVRKIAAAR
jgi:hypothetical protein